MNVQKLIKYKDDPRVKQLEGRISSKLSGSGKGSNKQVTNLEAKAKKALAGFKRK